MIDTNEFTKPLRGEVRSRIVRRRRWTAGEKGRIVAEAVAPCAIIAEVARRHELTPQHLSNWIRAARAGRFALPAPEESMAWTEAAGTDFVPVVTERPRAAFIEIIVGTVVVRVAAGSDAAMLERVLRAVKRT